MKRDLLMFQGAMIFFVAVVLTLAGNYIYKKEMLSSRMRYITELQRQLAKSFEVKISSVDDTLEILANTGEIKNYLCSADGENKIQYEQTVRDMFDTYENIHEDYLNMILVSNDGENYISNDMYRPVHESFYSEKWFLQAIQKGSSYQFDSELRNLQSWKHYDSNSYISIAKAVYEGEKAIGVLMVDVSLEEFKTAYQNLESDTENFFFLMDGNGKIILSPVNKIVYRVNPNWFTDDEGVVVSKIYSKSYKFVFNRFRNNKLLIVGAYNIDKERYIPLRMSQISICMAGICFLVAMIWSVCFLLKIINPLTELSLLMRAASEGNLDVRFRGKCKDDIQILGESFNKMVEKLKKLMEMMETEQKQKREAELMVMQEQIKPHFLYNTLDMISWMARKHGANDIVHLVETMSDFFRIGLSNGHEMISLKEELRMIQAYLEIQSMRYKDMFTYEIFCSPDIRDELVLRMCLQPLVENCLYHGIKESDNADAKIQIFAEPVLGGIKIQIRDNGQEIDDNIMEHLNRCLATNNWDDWVGGFGVKNVGRRLWHRFAKGSGLIYEKDRNGFTVVTLLILKENYI